MKNVHLISTIKPSKLIRDFNNKLLVNYNNVQNLRDEYDFQHLYITSDEVITEGDYIFSKKTNNLFKADDLEHLESHNMIEDFDKSFYINSKYAKKIILTTDVDLIKDGVQKIDDEFLEWFVKNPSCEEVEIKRDFADEGIKGITYYGKYFLIIPKEEPKQETLEEAAERYDKKYIEYVYDAFIEGAKWQMDKQSDFIIGFLEFIEGTYSYSNIYDHWYLHANTSKTYSKKQLLEVYLKRNKL